MTFTCPCPCHLTGDNSSNCGTCGNTGMIVKLFSPIVVPVTSKPVYNIAKQ